MSQLLHLSRGDELPAMDEAEAHRLAFLADCLAGLGQRQKRLSPKWFYDASGSLMFERICRVPEYYPARAEAALLDSAAAALTTAIAPGTTLVELGSGASRKTRVLLDALPTVACYVPIDLAADELARAAAAIERDYPAVAVHPRLADFTAPDALADLPATRPPLVFFPGSTIANASPDEAVRLLASMRAALGGGARLLLGVDVAKDEGTMIAAYDDPDGVTAAFNRNILHRMRRELSAICDPDAFVDRAVWNPAEWRIEMHLLARTRQPIALHGQCFTVEKGETIHTESSYKLPVDGWLGVFNRAGWTVEREWSDGRPQYLLALLRDG